MLSVLKPEFWGKCWEKAVGESPLYSGKSNQIKWMEFWNTVSDNYLFHNQFEQEFILKIINEMKKGGLINKKSNVLDIGCGPGTYSLPMSQLVSQITALDPAEKMLECLKKERDKKRIRNIVTACCNWEEYKNERSFDLVFASFSPGIMSVGDLLKMCQVSREYACIITSSKTDTLKIRDDLWKEIMGTPLQSHAFTILFPFNFLYTSGYRPNLRFVKHKIKYEDTLEHLIMQYEQYFRIFVKMNKHIKSKILCYLRNLADNGVIKTEIEKEVGIMWWRVN